MNISLHLKIVGLSLMLLALFHVVLPKRFDWQKELALLSLFNRQVMYVHTFFIALVVLMFGALTFFFTAELLAKNSLAQVILAGFAGFWAIRLFVQLFVYDAALWRGKRFETIAHILFTIYWVYCTAIYGWALFASTDFKAG